VRLLLDNNLSPRLVDVLAKDGWDVVHVGSLGLRAASDRVVLQTARDDGRILVSADTDFGTLLAASHEPGPSVVLVRRVIGRRVEQLAGLLLANLPQVDDDLRLGSIVVIGDDSLRIRRLPIG
jgi:predicted nuclease of predicted toxin-antitoxin system